MAFLANENFPRLAVQALRAAGHDVLWVKTEMPGASDEEVLARAQQDGRVLLTFDKDFGELAYRAKLPAECGIVLFRLSLTSPDHIVKHIVTTFETFHDWKGHFSIVEDARLRVRVL
jgi:predicted nuclease of predicted toxin-antitoxin system